MAQLLSMADIWLVAVKWCFDLLLHPHRLCLPELPFCPLPLALTLSLDFHFPFAHKLLLLSMLLLPVLLFPVLLLPVLLLPVLLLPVLFFPLLMLSVLLFPMLLFPKPILHVQPLHLSSAFALEGLRMCRLEWLGHRQWARISELWHLAGRSFLR